MSSKNHFYYLVSAPGVLAGLTLLIVGVSAAYYVDRLNRDVAQLVDVNIQNEKASEELLLSVRDIRLRLHEFLAVRDLTMLKAVMAKKNHTTNMIVNVLNRTPGFDESVPAVAAQKLFFKDLQQFIDDHQDGQASKRIIPLLENLTDGLLREVEQVHEANQLALKQANNRNLSVAHGMVWGLLAMGVCGGAAGMVSGFRIAARTVRRVEQSEQEATRAEQLATVGKIAASLAHEIHNPLMTMQVLTEGATEHGAEGRLAGRDLEILDEELKRLNVLMQSFLDFARPPEAKCDDFDVRDLIRQTIELLVGRAQQQRIRLETSLPDSPLIIEADPAQIRQVVINLLLNAIDAQPNGGKINVRAGYTSARDQRKLELCIQDDGCGIAPDKLDRIFDPFVSYKKNGLGLGLSVSRRLIESHGGSIVSEPVAKGTGTRFIVTLPIEQD